MIDPYNFPGSNAMRLWHTCLIIRCYAPSFRSSDGARRTAFPLTRRIARQLARCFRSSAGCPSDCPTCSSARSSATYLTDCLSASLADRSPARSFLPLARRLARSLHSSVACPRPRPMGSLSARSLAAYAIPCAPDCLTACPMGSSSAVCPSVFPTGCVSTRLMF